MRYLALGQLPPKRHAQVRDDGRLLVEEVMGYEGFSGNESILYHAHSPCRLEDVGPFTPIVREEWVPEAHVHRLADINPLAPGGDPVAGGDEGFLAVQHPFSSIPDRLRVERADVAAVRCFGQGIGGDQSVAVQPGGRVRVTAT